MVLQTVFIFVMGCKCQILQCTCNNFKLQLSGGKMKVWPPEFVFYQIAIVQMIGFLTCRLSAFTFEITEQHEYYNC